MKKPEKIQMGTEYVTRSGLPVRIYAVDGSVCRNVHGAVYRNGEWRSESWRPDGVYLSSGNEHAFDLFEKPEVVKVDFWINVYKDPLYSGQFVAGATHKTKESALQASLCRDDVVGCLRITKEFPEGEGL